jgi:hypothetical protein
MANKVRIKGVRTGTAFGFERSALLGKVIVDFRPDSETVGVYSEAEFENTFDVIEE